MHPHESVLIMFVMSSNREVGNCNSSLFMLLMGISPTCVGSVHNQKKKFFVFSTLKLLKY